MNSAGSPIRQHAQRTQHPALGGWRSASIRRSWGVALLAGLTGLAAHCGQPSCEGVCAQTDSGGNAGSGEGEGTDAWSADGSDGSDGSDQYVDADWPGEKDASSGELDATQDSTRTDAAIQETDAAIDRDGNDGSLFSPDGSGLDPSAEIYDPAQILHLELTLPPESVAALGGASNTYVRGSLRYATTTVNDIGVRIKGEANRRDMNGKPAFKLKFDEFVSNQSFYGLRGMTLNNQLEDPSFVAERLAYDLFRTAKLPAPRCNSVVLHINGVLYGVYANLETEDKRFLRRWFDDNDGNLYEESGVDFALGAEAHFDLETNEKSNDRSDLTRLIAVIQAAKPATYLEDLEAALDTTHFLRFTAAELAVNQWDMYAYSVFGINNLRIYDDPTRDKFVFIPWGMDMSMKPYAPTGKSHIPVFALARFEDNADGPITAGLLFQGCMASPTCRSRYADEVRQMVAIYESMDLGAIAKRYYEQIRADVYADPRKECTNEQFEASYRVVTRIIGERSAVLRSEL